MSHDHAHAHHPASPAYGRAFVIGIALNIGFVLIEALYGWRANSLALLADAGHNLSDVGGLVLAWAAYGAAQIQPNHRHTYGWRKASVLASFINAIVLLVAMGSLGWEALQRFNAPTPVQSVTVMVVAAVGVLINGVTAWLFAAGQHHDLNIRGAFVHMAADALISAGVVVAGALSWWQGWWWIDPVVSVAIAVVIVIGTWSLLRQSLHLLFDGVPQGIDLARVHQQLSAQPGVLQVHDLHVWAMGTAETALTAHLVVAPSATPTDALLHGTNAMLQRDFGIHHTTLQLESVAFADQCAGVNCVRVYRPAHQNAHVE